MRSKKNKKKSKFKKIFILPIVIIVLVIISCIYCYMCTTPVSKKSDKVTFEITSGSTIKDIATTLKDEELIRNYYFFLAYVKINKVSGIQAGDYSLDKNMSLKEITDILKKGSKASKAVKFESSKKSVVTVSKKGVLKAKKIGKAKITVKSKANPAKQVKFTVTVAKKNVLIKKISMKKKLTLHMPLVEDEDDSDDDSDDDTEDSDEDLDDEDDDDEDDEDEEDYEFEPRISPSNATNQTLKWTSSNKKVVKVDEDGYVYIVDAGKAVITAMATDGSGVKAKCTVTVIDDADTDDEDDDE